MSEDKYVDKNVNHEILEGEDLIVMKQDSLEQEERNAKEQPFYEKASNEETFYERASNKETLYEETLNERESSSKEKISSQRIKHRNKHGKGRFLKGLITLVASAAVFGLVAGAGFQLVQNNPFEKKNSTVQIQPKDEMGDTKENQNFIAASENDSEKVVPAAITNATVMDVSGVVENVMPAIVSINSSATQTQYDFFGRSYDNEVSGSGSGIIIGQNNSEILIVTNNHVVDGATAMEIVFMDDTKAAATRKGTEPSSDLAVVAVNINDLSKETKSQIKIATLGNSEEVKTGEMAIAIGNALGYGQSVTVGYISALNREVTVGNVTLHLIQTDAAINPGNSGGALLNASGEVIGINSVKYSDTNVEGIGYAIPISDAIPIINDLMNREKLAESESGYIGITGQDVDETAGKTFHMPVGLLISTVSDNSPAQAAGLHRGDIITKVNGKKITGMSDLRTFLSYTRAGTTITLTINALENGEYIEKDVNVELGSRPSQEN